MFATLVAQNSGHGESLWFRINSGYAARHMLCKHVFDVLLSEIIKVIKVNEGLLRYSYISLSWA